MGETKSNKMVESFNWPLASSGSPPADVSLFLSNFWIPLDLERETANYNPTNYSLFVHSFIHVLVTDHVLISTWLLMRWAAKFNIHEMNFESISDGVSFFASNFLRMLKTETFCRIWSEIWILSSRLELEFLQTNVFKLLKHCENFSAPLNHSEVL